MAHLTSLDPPLARDAVEAVLETLAVRLSDGEVKDPIEQLPADLRPALERGLTRSRNSTRMSLDQFLARTAEVEGVSRGAAERDAPAVFAAPRRLVPEVSDVEPELPGPTAGARVHVDAVGSG